MVNLDDVVAIDIHTHAEEPCGTHADDGYEEFQAGMAKYFKNPAGAQGMLPTVEETAAYYRERKIACVIFPVDAERETGFRRYPNEELAELAAEHADVLIPFASIDPAKGKAGAREARRLIADFGIRGFKFHPTMQGFYPNDRSAYVLYEAIAEAGAIALFHTGQTGVGARLPGHAHHPGAPILPLAGRGAGGRHPQAQRLHRPVRLVAEVFPADPDPVRQHAAQAEGAVRLGLAGNHAGPVACRFPEDQHPGRGSPPHPETKRGEASWPLSRRANQGG